MLNFENITPKKFDFNSNDYDKIHRMWKDKLTNAEIASEFKKPKSHIGIVVNQIVAFIASNKQKYEQIKINEKIKQEPACSYKDLLFPINNEATIGMANVIKGKIYVDGLLWK